MEATRSFVKEIAMKATTQRNLRNGKAELRRLAEVIEREVDAGADTVEEIHRAVAALPLDVLERIDVFAGAAREVRKAQGEAIGALYRLIRKVNHVVAKHATETLGGRAPRARAKRAASSAKRTLRRRVAHPHAAVTPLA
jgi:hypothetical protein